MDTQTYETFEKDPFKYAEYERAVYGKLRHCFGPFPTL